MFTILSKSASKKKLTHFRTHKWASSNTIQNDSTKTFWRVRTNFRRETFIEYLKLKLLYDPNLSSLELRFILDLDTIINDEILMALLRARNLNINEEVAISRFLQALRLYSRKELTKNLFFTLEGTILYELEECRQSIRRVKKFSGYVRNASSVGSKKGSNSSKPEPEIFRWAGTDEKIDWFRYITVGELSSGRPESIFFTLKRTKSPKR